MFQAGILAQLLDLYTHHEKLEEAMALKTQLFERDPEFHLDSMKAVKLASLLIKNDRLPGGYLRFGKSQGIGDISLFNGKFLLYILHHF